jgi:hypothetical protein
MRSAVRIYRSYEDFERDELRRLEQLSTPLEDLLSESDIAELSRESEEISVPARPSDQRDRD